jgi:hypothetical protein
MAVSAALRKVSRTSEANPVSAEVQAGARAAPRTADKYLTDQEARLGLVTEPAIPLNEKLATLLKGKKAPKDDGIPGVLAAFAGAVAAIDRHLASCVAIACSLAIAIAASAGHAAPILGNSPDSRCEGVIIIAEDNGWAPSLEQQEAEYQRCVAALEHGEVHPSRR